MLKTSKLLFSFLSTTDDAEFASFKSSTSNVPRPSSLNDFRTIEGYVTSEINPDYIEELKITAEKNKEVSGLFDEL